MLFPPNVSFVVVMEEKFLFKDHHFSKNCSINLFNPTDFATTLGWVLPVSGKCGATITILNSFHYLNFLKEVLSHCEKNKSSYRKFKYEIEKLYVEHDITEEYILGCTVSDSFFNYRHKMIGELGIIFEKTEPGNRLSPVKERINREECIHITTGNRWFELSHQVNEDNNVHEHTEVFKAILDSAKDAESLRKDLVKLNLIKTEKWVTLNQVGKWVSDKRENKAMDVADIFTRNNRRHFKNQKSWDDFIVSIWPLIIGKGK